MAKLQHLFFPNFASLTLKGTSLEDQITIYCLSDWQSNTATSNTLIRAEVCCTHLMESMGSQNASNQTAICLHNLIGQVVAFC